MNPDAAIQLPAKPMTRSEMARFIGRATVIGWRNRRAFGDVQTFAFLVGYPRSGSTLFGSMLNAHPEMVVAHEADILRYVRPGVTRNQLFAMLLERDRQFALIGRRFNGFDYAMPGRDQGQFTRLRVIGDKHAGRAARRIHADPGRLDRLRSTVGVPIRAVHLVRNPFDNIASIARNQDYPVARGIEIYRELSDAVDDVRGRLDPDELTEFRYEAMAARPTEVLTDVCRFLGVEPSAEYLRACAALADPSGRQGRSTVDWTTDEREQVEAIIAARPVLAGYTFDQ